MAIEIRNFEIISDYSWENAKNIKNWDFIKMTGSWQNLLQSAETGQAVKFEVIVTECTWNSNKELFGNRENIKLNFSDWSALKNQ